VHPWTIYALEVTRDRERRAEQRRLAADIHHEDTQPSRTRRSAALVFAALSRGSAAAVRRLDDCVADDLSRALAPTK